MDRFNDIWKNRFNDEEVPIGDWNTPDENLWEEIAIEVVPQKEKKRWLWFLLIGVLLLSGLFIWTSVSLKSNTGALPLTNIGVQSDLTAAQITDTLKIMSEVVSEVDYRSQFVNIDEEVALSNNKVAEKKNVDHEEKTESPILGRTEKSYKDASEEIEESVTKSVSITQIDKNVERNPIIDDLVSNEISTTEKTIIYSHLNLSSLLVSPVETGLNLNGLFSPSIEPLGNDESVKGFYLGFNMGTSFWKHRISDAYTSDLSPFDFNYSDAWGMQAKLTLGFSINEYIDIQTAIQYERFKSKSGHNSVLNYSLAAESNEATKNDYDVSLATPYGLSPASFSFLRSEEIADEAVDLTVDFHSEHNIQNVSLPIGISIYPLGQKKRLFPILQFGFGTNYLIGISNKIASVDTYHDAITLDKTQDNTFVKPDVAKWHFDYRVGAGLAYKLNRNVSLNLICDWTRGLTPIFEQELYKTQIDRYQISLGIRKTIRSY